MSVELAWAAGFFDGEGCSHRTGDGYLVVSISQCHREVLDKFRLAVGVGKVRGPYAPRREKWSPIWHYRAYGAEASLVLAAIWPYLGSVKRAQYETQYAAARRVHRKGYCRKDLHTRVPENLTNEGKCERCQEKSRFLRAVTGE